MTRRIITTAAIAALCATLVAPAGARDQNPSTPAQTPAAAAPSPADALPALNAQAVTLEGEIRSAARDVAKDQANADLGAKYRDLLARYRQVLAAQFVAKSTGLDAAARSKLATTMIADAQTAIAGQTDTASLKTLTDLYTAGSSDAKATLLGNAQASLDIQRAREEVSREAERQADVASWSATGAARGPLGRPDTLPRLKGLLDRITAIDVEQPNRPSYMNDDLTRATTEQRQIEVWRRREERDARIAEFVRLADNGAILDSNGAPITGDLRQRIGINAKLQLVEAMKANNIDLGIFGRVFGWNDQRGAVGDQLLAGVQADNSYQVLQLIDPSTAGATPQQWARSMAAVVRFSADRVHDWRGGKVPSPDYTGVSGQIYGNAVGRFFYENFWLKQQTGLDTVSQLVGYGDKNGALFYTDARIDEFEKDADAAVGALGAMASATSPSDLPVAQFKLLQRFGFIGTGPDGKPVFQVPIGANVTAQVQGDLTMPGASMLDVITSGAAIKAIVMMAAPQMAAARVGLALEALGASERALAVGEFVTTALSNAALDAAYQRVFVGTVQWDQLVLDTVVLNTVLPLSGAATNAVAGAIAGRITSSPGSRKAAEFVISHALGLSSDTVLLTYWQGKVSGTGMTYENFLANAFTGVVMRGAPVYSNVKTIWEAIHGPSPDLAAELARRGYTPEDMARLIESARFQEQTGHFKDAVDRLETVLGAEYLKLDLGDPALIAKVTEAAETGQLGFPDLKAVFGDQPALQKLMDGVNAHRLALFDGIIGTAQQRARADVNAEYDARAARLGENLAGSSQLGEALAHNETERKAELKKVDEQPKAPGSKNVTSDIDRSIASTYLRNELKLVTDEVFRKNRPNADPATSAKVYDVNEYFDVFQVIDRMRELKLDLTNVSVNEPGFGAVKQSDAIVAAGLAADMEHMSADQRVALRKNRATGPDAARMNRLFDIAEARLAGDQRLLNLELVKLGQKGLDTTNPDVLTRARDDLYGRRAQGLADLMATFERMDPKSPEYLKTAAMIEREWSYVKLAGIEAYTNFAGLDIVVNKAQMNDISIRELITGKVDPEQTAKVNKGRADKKLTPVTDEGRQSKITETLGEIKAQYGPDHFSGALDDQIRFIVDHVNAYYEGHESATQAGTALSKYAERAALFLKLAGRDMSTGQLKDLDAIAGILVKARGNPTNLNEALAKFGGGKVDAGLKKLAGLLSDTMPGLKGLFDPAMYLHDLPAAGSASTPGAGASWSAFQRRTGKERQELARTYGAGAVLRSISVEQTSLQTELQQLEKEKADDARLAPAYREQDFGKIRQLEDEARAIQTEINSLPINSGQVALDLRDKAANVRGQLANYRGYRPAGPAVLTPDQQRRDRRIVSIKAQIANNAAAATMYIGVAQVEANRFASDPGSLLPGGPTMGLDQISADPNANVVGGNRILPSAFDGLGKAWLDELETTGVIKPGPPVKGVTFTTDWSKIPAVSTETFVSGDIYRLQIRMTDYLQGADFDLAEWTYSANTDGSVSYTSKRTGQTITGRLVTKNEFDPVSGTSFRVTRIVIDKPADAGSANSTGGASSSGAGSGAAGGTGNGSLNFGLDGGFNLTPFPGSQVYPGLLIGNGFQLFSPGTIIDPNHPPAPVFTTPFPFFTAQPRTAGGGGPTYDGLNIFGLPGTPASGAAGSGFIFTPPPNTVGVMPGSPNDGPSVGPPFGWGESTTFTPNPKSSMAVEESTGAVLIDLGDGPVGPVVTGSPVPGFQMFLGDLRTPVIQPFSSFTSPSALWGALRWLFEPRAGVSGAMSEAGPSAARTRVTTGAPRGSAGAEDAGAPPPLTAIFTSLGVATGDAFEVRAINDGDRPARLVGAGLVLEPLSAAGGAQMRKEMDDAVKRRGGKAPAPTIAHMVAYCAEYAKLPPPAGMAFRVASPEVQAKYGALRRVLDAEQRLEQLGKLVPDLDPAQYFQQLRQWALWSKAEGFTADTFAKAFVDHAKKNFTAARQPWTKQIESQIAGLVPHRWQEIAMVLQEAAGR